MVGIRSVDARLLELGRSLRATRRQVLTTLEIPAALPNILGGMRVGVTLAVVGAIVGEWAGAERGLGVLINLARGSLFDTPLMFATLLTIALRRDRALPRRRRHRTPAGRRAMNRPTSSEVLVSSSRSASVRVPCRAVVARRLRRGRVHRRRGPRRAPAASPSAALGAAGRTGQARRGSRLHPERPVRAVLPRRSRRAGTPTPGLEVEFQNKIDPDLITLVGQGAIDIGIGDGTSVIPAVSQGIPVRYLATIYGSSRASSSPRHRPASRPPPISKDARSGHPGDTARAGSCSRRCSGPPA